MRPFALLLALGLLLPGLSLAQDWTRFRGPNGTGVAPDATLPVEITEANTLWKIEVPGKGYSSPVLWGDRIFLTCVEGETRSFLCFDAKTGELLWKKDRAFTPHHFNPKFANSATTAATSSSDLVYFTNGNGAAIEIEALTHEGEPVWKAELGGFDATDHGAIAPVVLVGDKVLLAQADHIGSGACFVGLDPKTGDELWRTERKNEKDNYGPPALHTQKNGQIQAIYAGMDHGFTALDPMTGKLIWEHNAGYQHRSVAGATVAEGLIFGTFGSGGGGKACAALHPGTIDRPAEVAFEFDEAIPYVPAPIIADGRLYLLLDSGMMSCADAKTGKLHYDRERLVQGGAKWFCSPVLGGDRILCCSHNGDVVTVRTGDKFEVLGRSNLGELINACPAIVGNRLYLRTEGHLLCVSGE